MDTIDFIREFPIKSFSKGEMLFYEGQESTVFYAIMSGFVKVVSVSPSGHERLLWIAGPSNFVPAAQLFETTITTRFFYTALSDCVVYKVDKAQFLDFVVKRLDAMTEIAKRMSNHFDHLITQLDSLEQISVRNKLIVMLTYLAKRFGANDRVDLYELGLRLTHNDLAEMVGSTRETASIELHKLSLEGGIRYGRSEFIIDVARLNELPIG